MTDRTTHSLVVNWLASVTGLVFIKANQMGPRPAEPYGMVNLLTTDEAREHPSNLVYTGTDVVTVEIEIENELVFSVHIYGEEATEYFRKIRLAKHLGSQEALLRAAGFTVHDVSQVRNVPEFENEQWKPRAQMDLVIRNKQREGSAVEIDVIEEAPINVSRI